MHEELFIPSSPDQAQQVIAQLEALMLRELGKPDIFGDKWPDIPSSSMPKFITDRYLVLPFELQAPASETDSVNPFILPNDEVDYSGVLAGVGFGREYSALHAQSLTEVMYCVVQKRDRVTEKNELGLTVATSIDVRSFSQSDSPENQCNQPLRDANELRQKMLDNPFAAREEIEAVLNTPSVTDLMLTDEQKKLQYPANVSYQEADLLINFISGLYR